MPVLDHCLYPVDRLRRGKRKKREEKRKEKKRKGVKRYLPSSCVASKVGKGAREPAVDFIKC